MISNVHGRYIRQRPVLSLTVADMLIYRSLF
jgi:hypothetical protein